MEHNNNVWAIAFGYPKKEESTVLNVIKCLKTEIEAGLCPERVHILDAEIAAELMK
ncbi:MAG: hypothetical protein Q8M94_01245 [Ignavibacteria bacterium]|nr:hypothetical protein [Ignavibacteria bacterium]